MSEKRDFAKDRAICDSVKSEKWVADGFLVYAIYSENEGIGIQTWDEKRAEFIAAAREGWPAALDEIERLQKRHDRLVDAELRYVQEIEKLRAELDSHESWKAMNEMTSRELQSARQSIERMRKVLDWVKEMYEQEWTYEPGTGEVVEDIIREFEGDGSACLCK